jgi:hypothetical protein
MAAPIESLARYLSSDDPGDWDRMSEAQRDYWRRMAGRVFVWQARMKAAQAEMAEALSGEAEAA